MTSTRVALSGTVRARHRDLAQCRRTTVRELLVDVIRSRLVRTEVLRGELCPDPPAASSDRCAGLLPLDVAAQSLQAKAHAALYGPGRQAEVSGDLGVAEFAVEGECYDLALLVGKQREQP